MPGSVRIVVRYAEHEQSGVRTTMIPATKRSEILVLGFVLPLLDKTIANSDEWHALRKCVEYDNATRTKQEYLRWVGQAP